ncbi:unnamed protein product [Arctogadus glacialis]
MGPTRVSANGPRVLTNRTALEPIPGPPVTFESQRYHQSPIALLERFLRRRRLQSSSNPGDRGTRIPYTVFKYTGRCGDNMLLQLTQHTKMTCSLEQAAALIGAIGALCLRYAVW